MKPEDIKERIELIDVFFTKDDISNESLTQNYCTEMTNDEEFLTSFFVEAFGFCGCGCLYMSIEFVRDILNCYEDEEDRCSPYLKLDKVKRVCGNDNITDFILHWLDSVELTEHGSSVYGSWLTNKGEALRKYLKKVAEEEEGAKDICTGHICGICNKFSVLRADGEPYQYSCALYNKTIPAMSAVRDVRPNDFREEAE